MLTNVNKRELIELPAEITPETIEAFRQSTARILAGEPELLLLDCSRILYMSSTHVGLMWVTHVDCERRDVEMHLINVSEQIRIVLRTLDLETVFLSDEDTVVQTGYVDDSAIAISSAQQFQDRVDLTKNGIEEGLGRFIAHLQALGIGSVAIFEVRLIYYEIMMNVKFHSGQTERDSVDFEAETDRSGITLTFKDRGIRFNPTDREAALTPEEAARSGQVRGFGLAMINKIVDSIAYTYENDTTNRLTIVKRWGKRYD